MMYRTEYIQVDNDKGFKRLLLGNMFDAMDAKPYDKLWYIFGSVTDMSEPDAYVPGDLCKIVLEDGFQGVDLFKQLNGSDRVW